MLPHDGASRPINVLLIEDHKTICAALKLMLEQTPAIRTLTKKRSDANEGLTADVIVLCCDVAPTHLEDLRSVRDRYPGTPILLFLKNRLTGSLKSSIKMGASGVFHSSHQPEMLVRAIEKVHRGEIWFERTLLTDVLHDFTDEDRLKRQALERRKIQTLTKRELEVISLIGEGLRNREICERIFVSEATISSHLNSIYRKLDVADRLSLVIYAFKHKLIDVANDSASGQ